MPQSSDEAAIRSVLEGLGRAISTKDADAALAPYAPEIVRYDLAPPLATQGPDALDRADLVAWFDTWRGPIRNEAPEMKVETAGDLALVYGLVRMAGTKTDGQDVDLWARQTVGLRRREGAWKIIHQHTSTPFYMDGSMKAAVDLKP
jgi:PhnB protein